MNTLILLHSILRYPLLILLIFCVIRSFQGFTSQRLYTNQDRRNALILMIMADVQLLLGLLLYFLGERGLKNIQREGMANIMGDKIWRFFAMEHILSMVLAIILIHVGRALSKRNTTEKNKQRAVFFTFTLALLLILSAIPWPFRDGFSFVGWF